MKLPRNRFGRLAAWATVAGLLFIAGTGHEGWSQPTVPVKIVVPFAAGGTADTLARLLADQIGRSFRQTMVIENRPGAGSVIGTESVARAMPDGTTILLMANSFTINSERQEIELRSADRLSNLFAFWCARRLSSPSMALQPIARSRIC